MERYGSETNMSINTLQNIPHLDNTTGPLASKLKLFDEICIFAHHWYTIPRTYASPEKILDIEDCCRLKIASAVFCYDVYLDSL